MKTIENIKTAGTNIIQKGVEKGSEYINYVKETLQNSLEKCEAQCSCEKPCNCLIPYEVSVNVVTRLGGIPVEGVRLQVVTDPPDKDPKFARSNSKGEITTFIDKKSELHLILTYSNREEKMKNEEVKITINNLTPTCQATTSATANFEHMIGKIRDVKDFEAVDDAKAKFKEAAEKFEEPKATKDALLGDNLPEPAPTPPVDPGPKAGPKTKAKYKKELADYNGKLAAWNKQTAGKGADLVKKEYDVAEAFKKAEGEHKKTQDDFKKAMKKHGVNEDRIDADFEDKYKLTMDGGAGPNGSAKSVVAGKPETLTISNTVDSEMLIGSPTNTKKHSIKVSLTVALDTFSLKVPYMNQNSGDVQVMNRAGDPDPKTKIAPPPVYKGQHLNTSGNYDINPWPGERLCSPTCSTMLLMYYGQSAADSAEIVNTSDDRLLSRAGLLAKYYTKRNPLKDSKIEKPPWENPEIVVPVLNTHLDATYPEDPESQNRGASYAPDLIPLDWNFKDDMPKIADTLVKGHPAQSSIHGGHLVVIRGAVISHDEKSLWVISNDPYGTLAGQQSDYSKHDANNSWYQGEGKRSSSRRERNVNDDNDSEPATKGKHVYYNEKTHTRTESGGVGGYVYFRNLVVLNFRHASETGLSDKDFTATKLIKGEAGQP